MRPIDAGYGYSLTLAVPIASAPVGMATWLGRDGDDAETDGFAPAIDPA